MKTLIVLLLLTSVATAQQTNFHFYYGSNEALGAEILINESFGFGFSGTTEKDKALGVFSTGGINEYDKKNFVSDTRQKWFHLYAMKHIGYIGQLQISVEGGFAMHGTHSNFLDPNRNEYYHKKKEITFRPTVGINATYAITDDIGRQIGFDTFSGLNTGFVVYF